MAGQPCHRRSGIGTYLSVVSKVSWRKGHCGFLWIPAGIISLLDAGTDVCFYFHFLFGGDLRGTAFLPDDCSIPCDAGRFFRDKRCTGGPGWFCHHYDYCVYTNEA